MKAGDDMIPETREQLFDTEEQYINLQIRAQQGVDDDGWYIRSIDVRIFSSADRGSATAFPTTRMIGKAIFERATKAQ